MSALAAALRAEVAQLEAWAEASRTGGWSTHQVKPMLARANELKALLYDTEYAPDTVHVRARRVLQEFEAWVDYLDRIGAPLEQRGSAAFAAALASLRRELES